jgi:hypothetical protein
MGGSRFAWYYGLSIGKFAAGALFSIERGGLSW